jgi:hypothetical protein
MGYELRIVRAADSTKPVEISMAEWRAAVEASTDLRLIGAIEVRTPAGETVRYENPGLAEWRGHPEALPVPLDFRRGQIFANSPDDPTIARMKALARQLDARLQGDEGEFYD